MGADLTFQTEHPLLHVGIQPRHTVPDHTIVAAEVARAIDATVRCACVLRETELAAITD